MCHKPIEFLIDDLDGNAHHATLQEIGACFPDDDVIYVGDAPCRLSSARYTPVISAVRDAVLLFQRPPRPVHGEELLENLVEPVGTPSHYDHILGGNYPALHITAAKGSDPVADVVDDLDALYGNEAALRVWLDEGGFHWLLKVRNGVQERHLQWLTSVGATFTYTPYPQPC